MDKLVLIDGHSILNRAFFGLPDLTNSEGVHTNAVLGFLNILFKIVDEENPQYLVVAFDVKAPTFRHEMFPEYKGTRKPMAEELRQQVPIIKDVLKAMDVTICELPGYEADDILGTLAYRGEKEGLEVSLVSGDRDLLQIATNKIKIRIPKTKFGKTTIEDYYAEDVINTYKVDPKTFIELKALMGDTADNIPGVPKVGEKTASELLITYGSLDNIFDNLDKITKNALHQTLNDNKDLAYLSKKLATINTDAPVEIKITDAPVRNFYTEEAYKLFKKLEFKNLLSKFETTIDYTHIADDFRCIDELNQATQFITELININSVVGLSVIRDDKTADLLGVSISTKQETVFIKKWLFITEDTILDFLNAIGTYNLNIATNDIKNLYRVLKTDKYQIMDDIILMAYLINPLKNDYSVIDIANEYLGMLLPLKEQLFKKLSLADAMDKYPKEFCEYVCFESYVSRESVNKLKDTLKDIGEYELYEDIEKPLSLVLSDMEDEGILVVPEELKQYSAMLGENITRLENKIYELAGGEFNINSPKQLGEILFEKLGIPGGKKTKTGYSTAADVLEKLKPDYPIVQFILDYRAYTKLKSTYADGLANYIGSDGRIHSTFHQTITATGRLSSADPNLQNIPIKMDLGRKIRKVFIPRAGYIFMDADYSQIELRVLASLAKDENLIKAYSEHADIHRITASQVFHVPFEEVTDLMRRNAKAVNFGIVYGISAFGLGEDLGISPKEAKKYMEDYFITYPKIKEFLDNQVINAKETGYTTTYYGRRRPIPELGSSNFMQRGFGERVAMNSPIQGTAADIIKIAMINVYNRLKYENCKSKLTLQVHDELLLEVLKEEEALVEKILREEMINATSLAVQMEVDLHTGANWYEAK